MKRVFGGFSLQGAKAGKDGMSSFQALTTAIAAQVGTGNIAGCATAIVSGGPGAIFWMWLSAFFGMSTIYAEAVLAQNTKTRDEDGHVIGGPAYYIRAAFSGAFGAPKAVMGVICALIAGFIFIGGLSRIASFTEKIVPIMAILYIIGSLILIIIHIGNLQGAIASIFIGAFSPQALGGAAIGLTVKAAVRFGIARGLFSNEAGMGSTPHAHALARVEHPAEQGETAMVGVFIDTFVVLNMTALVILTSGVYEPLGDLTGTALAQKAFESGFGTFGNMFVAVCLLFFAFSTIFSSRKSTSPTCLGEEMLKGWPASS
jgi:AGCS family alanine or glycine:cation symporter